MKISEKSSSGRRSEGSDFLYKMIQVSTDHLLQMHHGHILKQEGFLDQLLKRTHARTHRAQSTEHRVVFMAEMFSFCTKSL